MIPPFPTPFAPRPIPEAGREVKAHPFEQEVVLPVGFVPLDGEPLIALKAEAELPAEVDADRSGTEILERGPPTVLMLSYECGLLGC